MRISDHGEGIAAETLAANGMDKSQVDWLIPHQANIRIMTGTAKKLRLPLDKLIVTVDEHGNTSAASIPLALAVADAEGRFKPGDVIVTEAIGGGLSWGSVILRW